MDDLSPEELAEAKLLEMEKAARVLRENTSKEEGIQEGIERGIEIGKERGIEIGKRTRIRTRN